MNWKYLLITGLILLLFSSRSFSQSDWVLKQDKDGIKTIGGKRVMASEYSNHFAEWSPFEHKFYIILTAGVGGKDAANE